MKLVFAGTPDFAASALTALIDAGHDIALVMTQPDRPSGRGLRVQPSPVKALAVCHGIPVMQPQGLRIDGRHHAEAEAAQRRLEAVPHDAMIVAAYGLIVPQAILDLAPHGCINIHASLLPRWRGAAPIQRAIEAGDLQTGITIMQMDAGLDTGPMLLVRPTAILADDTAATLSARLAGLGGSAIVEALARLATGDLVATPQHADGDEARVTYAAKLSKAETPLDFAQPTRALVDRIRAFDPWPGCSVELVGGDGETPIAFKVWKAVAAHVPADRVYRGRVPGAVLGLGGDGGVLVATTDGAVRVTELQKAGGRRQPAALFAAHFVAGSGAAPDLRFRPVAPASTP